MVVIIPKISPPPEQDEIIMAMAGYLDYYLKQRLPKNSERREELLSRGYMYIVEQVRKYPDKFTNVEMPESYQKSTMYHVAKSLVSGKSHSTTLNGGTKLDILNTRKVKRKTFTPKPGVRDQNVPPEVDLHRQRFVNPAVAAQLKLDYCCA